MSNKRYHRRPRGYDGPGLTSHKLTEILPFSIASIGAKCQERPEAVMAAWKGVIGERFAPMTDATRFEDGILTVHVTNATLFSLLSQHEKGRLLQKLRAALPGTTIRNITFRMG